MDVPAAEVVEDVEVIVVEMVVEWWVRGRVKAGRFVPSLLLEVVGRERERERRISRREGRWPSLSLSSSLLEGSSSSVGVMGLSFSFGVGVLSWDISWDELRSGVCVLSAEYGVGSDIL